MSAFTTFDGFELVEGTDYVLTETVEWEIGRKGSGWKLELETGLRFNLSVPWVLWWVLSPHDRIWLPASAGHDKLLEEGFDRAFAAAEFRRMVAARVERAIADGKIEHDRRVWIAFWLVLLWTVREAVKD